MGLFDGVVADRKDDKIVTKTVQGKNTEVGRRKIELVEEMRSQGYELVNEISESGVVEGYFGNTTPGTRYTLTFRLNEQLAAEIKAREEKRRKEEEARIRRKKREECGKSRKSLHERAKLGAAHRQVLSEKFQANRKIKRGGVDPQRLWRKHLQNVQRKAQRFQKLFPRYGFRRRRV